MARFIDEMREILKDEDPDLAHREKILCSEEDSIRYRELLEKGEPMPDGIMIQTDEEGSTVFYEWRENQLTDAEWREYLAIKQYLELKTIRKCVVFFTALAVIALILGAISIDNIF